jgi:2-C-methyl-D-erythritol 4-phosphate cytidylyltransferase
MQNDLPKQFMKVNGKEIIMHVIEKFLAFDSEIKIIIPVHTAYHSLLQEILIAHKINNVLIANGGGTRFESVKNGLEKISDTGAIVGIHDSARPLVNIRTIKACYDLAKEKGNATPAVTVNETIRQKTEKGSRTVNRNDFLIIQTPQCFRIDKIKKAFEQPYSEKFTDDASVLEAAGEQIYLVEGNSENIKITHSKDLLIAKVLLDHEQ